MLQKLNIRYTSFITIKSLVDFTFRVDITTKRRFTV